MDLIVTDAGHIDRAVIEDYALDAAWGADEKRLRTHGGPNA